MIGTFDSEITGSLDFTVSLMWDYIADPTPNEDGTIPNSNDVQLIVGISYDY